MIVLPNFSQAVIAQEKLENYALNPEHPDGKHKAKLFREILGIERRHAAVLAELIRHTLPRAPAEKREVSSYGVKWVTYHEIVGLNGQSGIVTVAWMFRSKAEQIPVLVSCYIEPDDQERLRKLFSE